MFDFNSHSGDRLRELREQKKLSQGDIENCCGLLRGYRSRVENGHTVPNIETLEKWAPALEVPLYSCSTTANSRLRCQILQGARRKLIFCGAVRAKAHGCSRSSANYLAECRNIIASYFFIWLKRWLG